MATLHRSRSGLQSQLHEVNRPGALGVLLGVFRLRKAVKPLILIALCAAVYLFVFPRFRDLPFWAYLIPGALILASAVRIWLCLPKAASGKSAQDQADILRAGIAGEEKALRALEQLPAAYHVFNNLVIPYGGGRTSETDLIAVGPGGVSIIEVKNYRGEISGDLSDYHLLHRKSGPEEKEEECYNPVRQVATHRFALRMFLQEKGLTAPDIQTLVYFPDEALVSGLTDSRGIQETEDCHVFFGAQQTALLSAVEQFGALGPDQVRRIVQALDKLVR